MDIGSEGEGRRKTTNDLFGFLTTAPNAEVKAVHPKAMPVILTEADQLQTWLTAPAAEALKLQRPLADQSLKIFLRGEPPDLLAAHPPS